MDKFFEILFLDSNSIIYDCMRDIEYNNNNNDYERKLINAVCKKIETYIQQISPTRTVYIAFDGVAPVAKLNQQKNRRYKSWFMGQYDTSSAVQWNSSAITPGTEFMNKLNLQARYHFRKPSSFNVNQIIVSGSDYPGEGEHKIFDYIRENNVEIKDTKSVIYGLDADLIMLSMIRDTNVILLRERTEYNIEKTENDYIYLKIDPLKDHIIQSLDIDQANKEQIINDYIFICYFLGNDFPTNPAACCAIITTFSRSGPVMSKSIDLPPPNPLWNKLG